MKRMNRIPSTLVFSIACLGSPLVSTSTTFANELGSSPTSIDQQMEIVRHHLVPEYLCAAGVTSIQVSGIIDVAIESIDAHWDQLQSVQAALQLLKAEAGSLGRLVSNGQADDEQIASFQALSIQIESAQNDYDLVYETIDQAILSSMSLEQRTRFVVIRSNRSRGVAIDYQALTLDDGQWVELKAALAAVRTYDEENEEEEAPTAAIDLISQYDANYEVNLVRVHTDTNLSAVNTVFISEMSSLGM